MVSPPSSRLLADALAGHQPALDELIDLLTPVVQARVARVVLGFRHGDAPTAIRQQVEDLTQDVFLLLFHDEARILRSWDPERGLSIENFVGLVATRRTLSTLRTGKGQPWREDPTLIDRLDKPDRRISPEGRAASREELRLLLGRLQEELSPLGWRLFQLLLIEERAVADVERETRMSRDAIYAWRSRLRRLARRLLAEIASDAPERARMS